MKTANINKGQELTSIKKIVPQLLTVNEKNSTKKLNNLVILNQKRTSVIADQLNDEYNKKESKIEVTEDGRNIIKARRRFRENE